MVFVYAADVRNVPDPLENPKVMENLPEKRKEKINRIRRVSQRKQSLGAGLLLEYVKGQHLDNENMYYNLSHSEDYVICAASTKPVGCDLEKIEEAPLKVAERYFCKGEIDYLNSLDPSMCDDEFYRIWTAKESYMKMVGKGLSMGLGSFEVNIGETITLSKDGKRLNCYIKEYNLEGYKISVCCEDNCYTDKLLIVEI